MEDFDKEDVYDKQFNPLVAQLIALCHEHSIPMLATFQYAQDSEGPGASYCTTLLPDEAKGKNEALVAAYRTLLNTEVDGEYVPPPLIMTTVRKK